jgi:hypothetical protein
MRCFSYFTILYSFRSLINHRSVMYMRYSLKGMVSKPIDFERIPPQLELVAPLETYTDDELDEFVDTVLWKVHEDSEGLVTAMEALGDRLPAMGLEHLVPFNTAYLSLSGDVRDAVKESSDTAFRFSHPEVVERTMGIFAELYFRQVRAHRLIGSQGVDEAWRPLFYSKAGKNAPPGIQFLLGMNAHIVYDLPQALSKSGVTEDYFADYTKVVGDIIDKVAAELSLAYVPGTGWMRKFLTDKTVLRIADWRANAWWAGKQLQDVRDGRDRGHFGMSVPKGRIAAKGVMRECKRSALKNARYMRYAGRVGLAGVSSIGGRPPMDVADLMRLRAV